MTDDPRIDALRRFITENGDNMLPADVGILERNLSGLESKKIRGSELDRDIEGLIVLAQTHEFYRNYLQKRAALLGAAKLLREARDALPEDRKNR